MNRKNRRVFLKIMVCLCLCLFSSYTTLPALQVQSMFKPLVGTGAELDAIARSKLIFAARLALTGASIEEIRRTLDLWGLKLYEKDQIGSMEKVEILSADKKDERTAEVAFRVKDGSGRIFEMILTLDPVDAIQIRERTGEMGNPPLRPQYVRGFGKTGLILSALGIGTIWMGRKWPPGNEEYSYPEMDEVYAYLDNAFEKIKSENSLIMIDTAAAYGMTEKRLGQYLRKRKEISERVLIATKWGEEFNIKTEESVIDHSKKRLGLSVSRSFERLGRIDLLYIHGATVEVLKDREVMAEMQRMRSRGSYGISLLGASISRPNVLEAAVEEGLLKGLDVVQVPSSIVREKPDLISRISGMGIAVVVNSPVRKGGDITPEDNYHELLKDQDVSVILTGTRNHFDETLGYVKDLTGEKGPDDLPAEITAEITDKFNGFTSEVLAMIKDLKDKGFRVPKLTIEISELPRRIYHVSKKGPNIQISFNVARIDSLEEAVSIYWDVVGGVYADIFREIYDEILKDDEANTYDESYMEAFQRDFIGRCDIEDDDNVLDMGTGAGWMAFLAAKRAAKGEVVGIDISPVAIGLAKENAALLGLENTVFLEADATRCVLEDGKFDVVISQYTFARLPQELKRRALREAHRMLKKGGKLRLWAYHPTAVEFAWPEEVWTKELENAGFEVEEIYPMKESVYDDSPVALFIKAAKADKTEEKDARSSAHDFLRELLHVIGTGGVGDRSIIGLDTEWIPEMQKPIIQPLIAEIRRIAKSQGFENLDIVSGKGGDLSKDILLKCEETNTPYNRVIVFANNETLETDVFDHLRTTDTEEKAFLVGINPENLHKTSYVNLLEMLTMGLKLSQRGKLPLDNAGVIIEEKGKRYYIFIPLSEPYDYQALKELYNAQKQALASV